MRWLAAGLAALLAGCGNSSAPLSATVPGSPSASTLQIKSLSNRADLLSGGDALIEIVLPTGTPAEALRVEVDGRDVSAAFARRANGRVMGLLTGLAEKTSTLTARAAGAASASLALSNHPNGGPVFAGPQVQPWPCLEGAVDAQCNRPVSYLFKYRSTRPGGTNALAVYNPANPPTDVAMTTTDQGRTVPFVVRIETGAQDRGQYQIAVLFDPAADWQPWAPQPGWNGKTVITGGSGCGMTHGQAAGPSVEVVNPLGLGFAVMTTSLAHNTLNCNLVVQAEALMMLKERLIEAYGPIRYTIGTGCSGGSIYQQQVANAYPGIFDGIIPACSFPDTWSTMIEVMDCRLLLDYWSNPARWAPTIAWSELAQAAVAGHESTAVCQSWVNIYGFDSALNPRPDPRLRDTQSCKLAAGHGFDPVSNPRGTRCALQDYMVSAFGTRAQDGHARRPLDNVGIQYGFGALRTGVIGMDQFLDLNRRIGGRDIDYQPTAERMQADPEALEIIYRGGLINEAHALDRVPMIDLRGHDTVEIHHDYRSYVMRARLDAANGHHDNQVIWTGPGALVGHWQFEIQALAVMDAWLSAIEADGSALPLEEKVRRHKPAAAVDRCADGNGRDLPTATCSTLNPYYAAPRIVAGQPFTDDVWKCQTKPLDRADYARLTPAMSEAQWAELQAIFPQGVCDYRRPGVGQQPAEPWLDYRPGPAGAARSLPAEPVSRPSRD